MIQKQHSSLDPCLLVKSTFHSAMMHFIAETRINEIVLSLDLSTGREASNAEPQPVVPESLGTSFSENTFRANTWWWC
jgi:hypothetical protein